jgi:hypothetical protein
MQKRQTYSVAEIGRMRAAAVRLHQHGEFEEYLRTYMMNGTDPQELEDAATEAEAKRQEAAELVHKRLREKPKTSFVGF